MPKSLPASRLLSPTERAVRRKRCVGFTYSEMSNQKSFHAVEQRNYSGDPNKASNPMYRDLREHIRLFHQREQILAREPKAENTPTETGFVIAAAKWVDNHLPADHGRSYPAMVLRLAPNVFTCWAPRSHMDTSGPASM
jgi:hypothetical protein